MTDILIYESGNGGEMYLKNGDIEMTDGLFNQPYLAHFGGNTEASTTGEEQEGTERFDWWGNALFFAQPDAQMNSNLERTLNKTALSSAGRLEIERQAAIDIDYLAEIATVASEAAIIGNDKIRISDKLNQSVRSFTWDATKNEIIKEVTI